MTQLRFHTTGKAATNAMKCALITVLFALAIVLDPNTTAAQSSSTPAQTPAPPSKLSLPGETFTVLDRPAFLFLPEASKRSSPQPWIFMHRHFPHIPTKQKDGCTNPFSTRASRVAGVDVGEAYGSPASHPAFNALYEELTINRDFAKRACLFGRSRGGLWVSSWAIAHPERVSGIIGIYPVFDFRTYPKLENAAPAFGLSSDELDKRSDELNPIKKIDTLARAKIPITIIHGDQDVVVPLEQNSAELKRVYGSLGAGDLVNLIVAPGQGHSFWNGFFNEPKLVQFGIERARDGAK